MKLIVRLLIGAMFALPVSLLANINVHNRTPYMIMFTAEWQGVGRNNSKIPLILGPGQEGKIKGDRWDIKSKYKVAANVYTNNFTDMVTERGAWDSFNPTLDILVGIHGAGDQAGESYLAITKHTKHSK